MKNGGHKIVQSKTVGRRSGQLEEMAAVETPFGINGILFLKNAIFKA